MPCSEVEWSAQCLFLFHLDVQPWAPFHVLIIFSKPCLYFTWTKGLVYCGIIFELFKEKKNTPNIDEKSILSFLLFIHVEDQCFNLGWISVQMTFLPLKNGFKDVRWMYLLSLWKQRALTVINFINGVIWLTALSSCHQMCVRKEVETDIAERHAHVAYWSLKDFTS